MPDRWFDTNFTRRRKLTFNNEDQAEALIDFPIWVKLNSSRIDYSATQSAGQDLRFVQEGHLTQLAHETEVFNEAGESSIWVKIPIIDRSSKCIHCWMYYNNPAAADSQNAAGVWSNGYEGVWHMSEDPSGTPPQILDSLSAFNLTTFGSMTTGDLIDGEVGKAMDLDGTDDQLQNTSLGDSATETEISSIIVFQTKNIVIPDGIAFQRVLAVLNEFWRLEVLSDGKIKASIKQSPFNVSVTSDEIFKDDLRHTMVFEFERIGADDSRFRLYIDGVLKKTGTIGLNGMPITATGGVFQIGNNLETEVDEARVSFVKRTANWYAAQHLSLTDKFITFGNEQALDTQIRLTAQSDENSRRSSFMHPAGTVLPLPDGTVELRDKRHVLYLYNRPGSSTTYNNEIIVQAT